MNIVIEKNGTREYVLIETLWNVNQELQTDIEIINFVLIETLWNVNSNDDIELLDHMLY